MQVNYTNSNINVITQTTNDTRYGVRADLPLDQSCMVIHQHSHQHSRPRSRQHNHRHNRQSIRLDNRLTHQAIFRAYKWRFSTKTVSHRLTEYLQKYSVAIIILTMFGDFYSCIWLIQSKLFRLDIFNFSLKQTELDQLIAFRFISRTVFEVCKLSLFFFFFFFIIFNKKLVCWLF